MSSMQKINNTISNQIMYEKGLKRKPVDDTSFSSFVTIETDKSLHYKIQYSMRCHLGVLCIKVICKLHTHYRQNQLKAGHSDHPPYISQAWSAVRSIEWNSLIDLQCVILRSSLSYYKNWQELRGWSVVVLMPFSERRVTTVLLRHKPFGISFLNWKKIR